MEIKQAEDQRPRREPLVVDYIAPGRLAAIRAYIRLHSGSFRELADGGYLVGFPEGTLQKYEHNASEDGCLVYDIEFPDKARMTWYQEGCVRKGIPHRLRNSLGIPE